MQDHTNVENIHPHVFIVSLIFISLEVSEIRNGLYTWVKVLNFQILNFQKSDLKTYSMPTKYSVSSLNGQLPLDRLKINQRRYYILPNSAFRRLTFCGKSVSKF